MQASTSQGSHQKTPTPGMLPCKLPPMNNSDFLSQQSYYYATLCNDLRIINLYLEDHKASHRAVLAKFKNSQDDASLHLELFKQREAITKYEQKAMQTEDLIARTKHNAFRAGKVRWDEEEGWMMKLGGLGAGYGEVPLRDIGYYINEYSGTKE
ncbi:hypothetical protein EDC01DRAFT_421795 [Geopyxis carbonaria]|nr:hypothetical protein EDC01DRAFT_421795 [Geopyxis carbonaria]